MSSAPPSGAAEPSFIAGACSLGDDSANMFHSPVYDYSIDLPSGWTSIRASGPLEDGAPPATASGRTDMLGANANTRASAATKTVAFMMGCNQPDGRFPLAIDGAAAVVLFHIVWFDHPGELADQRAELPSLLAGFSFQ